MHWASFHSSLGSRTSRSPPSDAPSASSLDYILHWGLQINKSVNTILCIIWWNWFFVWINRKVLTWFGWVFGVVKHQHVRGGGLGGDDAVVLWHVSGSVHFSFMIDLNLNFDLSAYRPKPSKLWKQMPIHIHWQLSLMFFFTLCLPTRLCLFVNTLHPLNQKLLMFAVLSSPDILWEWSYLLKKHKKMILILWT